MSTTLAMHLLFVYAFGMGMASTVVALGWRELDAADRVIWAWGVVVWPLTIACGLVISAIQKITKERA